MPKKTVLVTGATGLLGRQVVRAFSYYAPDSDDWIVKGTGFSRAGQQSVDALDGKPVGEVIKVDLADAGQVEGLLGGLGVDVVVHCWFSFFLLPFFSLRISSVDIIYGCFPLNI